MSVKMDLQGKSILILGGGPQQLRLIQRAKARGAFVVVSDQSDKAPGLALADKHLCCSNRDVEFLTAAVKRLNLEAITTLGSDKAMVTVAEVAKNFGLKFNLTKASARIATHKEEMGEAFQREKVPMSRRTVLKDGDSWEKCLSLSFPLVLKPSDSQGQKGITKVSAPQELSDAITFARDWSSDGKVIVDEFTAGLEIAAHAWAVDGNVIWIGLTDRVTYNPDPFLGIAFQHIFPSRFSCSHRVVIHQIVQSVLTAYEMRDGPLFIQMIVGKNGVTVIEAGARVSGGNETVLFQAVAGVDFLDASLNLAIGIDTAKCFQNLSKPRHGIINFILANPGIVASQSQMHELISQGFVDDGGWYREIGFQQGRTQDAYGRIGWFMQSGYSRNEVLQSARQSYSRIVVRDTQGRSMQFWPDLLSFDAYDLDRE